MNNAICVLTTYLVKGEPNALIGPGVEGMVGCLGYILVALPILLIPGALAASAPASRNVEFVQKALVQTELGTTS